MNRSVAIRLAGILVSLGAGPAPAFAQPVTSAALPPCPLVRATLTAPLDSATANVGDRISFTTISSPDGADALPAGLTGYGIVDYAQHARRAQGGELSIEEGKYVAYGRKLDIERGRLLFNGGSVTDPAIDIRAIKQFPDIKAGVNVRGTLQAPRITFFSDPPVPQSQIVSLLLAGGSLESLQGATPGAAAGVQNQNAATRNELLAQGGAMLAQQLGAKIGLEDVGLESNLANETSLVLGST